jgi:hypothetical protein
MWDQKVWVLKVVRCDYVDWPKLTNVVFGSELLVMKVNMVMKVPIP